MKKYLVSSHVTISCYVEVEADNEAEAKKIAQDLPMAGLCYQCSKGEDDAWNVDSLDGEPSTKDMEATEL